MASLNLVCMIGNLGRDPELKVLPNGTPVCNFSIAVTESWMKDGERQSNTTWLNCKIFGKQGETAEKYLRKGRQVHITGKLNIREYTDKEGNKKQAVEINVQSFVMLGAKPESEGGGERQAAAQQSDTNGGSGYEDDIPF